MAFRYQVVYAHVRACTMLIQHSLVYENNRAQMEAKVENEKTM